MATALVTGANGILGRLLVDRLASDGNRVRAFVRSSSPELGNHPRIDLIHGDIRDAGDVRRATEGVDVVFHLAALVHAGSRNVRPFSDYSEVNVGGTTNIVTAVEGRAARVVFFSTINVYGPGHGNLVDETAECRPDGAYAVTKRNAELVVQRLGDRAIILRLAAVFGRSMKGNYPRLVRSIRRGRFVRIGSGSNRKTVANDNDVVQAAILAAFAPAAGGHVYNVTDGATHTIDEIIDAIAAACDVAPPRLRIPAALARLGARGLDAFTRAMARPAGALGAVEKYLEDVAVSGGKIQQHLGFQPAVDLWTGWRMALQP